MLAVIANAVYFRLYLYRNYDRNMLFANHAVELEKAGVWKAGTYMHMASIYNESMDDKRISDSHLNYIINCMNHPVTNKESAQWMAKGDGLIFLHDIPYTPAQSSRVYDYVEPMLRSKYPVEREYAIRVFGPLGDKRIIPELVPFLHDPGSTTVFVTRESLNKLGYKAS